MVKFTAKKLFLVFLGLAAALTMAETGLRFFCQKTTLKFYDNDAFGSALVPNQKGLFVSETKEYSSEVVVNSHG